MEPALKQRLVGAIVLIALAVIFLPMLLDGSGGLEQRAFEINIPERKPAPQPAFDSQATQSEPVAEPEAATAPAAEQEPVVTGWVIQVGSFTREANAVVLRDRLRDSGYAAFVAAGEADGSEVWRVRIGPVAEESEAQQLARKLESERGRPALVMSHP